MRRAIVLVLMVAVAVVSVHADQVDRDRNQALEHLRKGQEALETERYEEAEREFLAAIALNPRLELAHYGLGQVGMATKQYRKVIAAYSNCRDAFHQNEGEGRSDALATDRRIDDQLQSLRDFRNALQNGRVRSQDLSGSLRRVDNEIRQLEAAQQRSHPTGASWTPPYILTALGSAYFRTGAFEDAEREWRLALAIDPNIGEVHNNLAVVCMLTNRYDEAAREIELAEKAGFKVSPGLKQDLKAKRGRSNE
jgi:tetratricopeptide (TPR) repeat protein